VSRIPARVPRDTGGVNESRGKLLSFIDDDVEVSHGWLSAIHRAFEDPAVALVGGPSIPKFTDSIPAWFWSFLSPTLYGGWMCYIPRAPGAYRYVRRRL
jgi:hypothetical protein